LEEGFQIELEAIEAPGLQNAIEAGLDERAVGLFGQAAQRLTLGLALAEHRAQRISSGENVGRYTGSALGSGAGSASWGRVSRGHQRSSHSPQIERSRGATSCAKRVLL